MLPLALGSIAASTPSSTMAGWLAFAYVSLVSMFLGFLAWYRGLAIGPMTRVSQVQHSQSETTLLWSALLLGERLTLDVLLGAAAVIACATLAVRARGGAGGQAWGPVVTGPIVRLGVASITAATRSTSASRARRCAAVRRASGSTVIATRRPERRWCQTPATSPSISSTWWLPAWPRARARSAARPGKSRSRGWLAIP